MSNKLCRRSYNWQACQGTSALRFKERTEKGCFCFFKYVEQNVLNFVFTLQRQGSGAAAGNKTSGEKGKTKSHIKASFYLIFAFNWDKPTDFLMHERVRIMTEVSVGCI